MKILTETVTIVKLILDKGSPHAFGVIGEEDIFVPMWGRQKTEGSEKEKVFTGEYDPNVRVKRGDKIIALLEDNGKARRCAAQWTTKEIWDGKPTAGKKKTEKSGKTTSREDTIPHASNYKVGLPKNIVVPTPAPEKILEQDNRTVRIKLKNPDEGQNPQLFCNGNLKKLCRWIEENGIPKKDFYFDVEKTKGVWVPADKRFLKGLVPESQMAAA